MIYRIEPDKFNPKIEVASCFLEMGGDILLLLRQDKKPYGNCWGVPAGKLDKGENPLDAMVRETFEETGIKTKREDARYFDRVFVRYPEYDFIYHIFKTTLTRKEPVILSPLEHKSSLWLPPKDALELSLVPDGDACIRLAYNI